MQAINLPDRRNLSQSEQVLSLGAGALLALLALRRAPLGVILAALSGLLFYRGLTAHCPIFGALGITTRPRDLAADEPPAESQIDATLADSFPASDPPGWTSGSSFTQVDQ
jgi:uncharacterized membrane protein